MKNLFLYFWYYFLEYIRERHGLKSKLLRKKDLDGVEIQNNYKMWQLGNRKMLVAVKIMEKMEENPKTDLGD